MARNEAKNTEAVDPKEAAKEAKKLARREAQARVREYIKELEDGNPLKADLTLLVGTGQRAARGTVRSINNVLLEALVNAGDKGLTEMDIFKQFKIGRPEMKIKIRIFVKTPNPDDRVWVKFDESDETYRVISKGADVPEGWDSYVPSDDTL